MSGQYTSIESQIPIPKRQSRPVWGPWATIGFALAITAITIIVSFFVAVAAGVLFLTSDILKPNISEIMALFAANAGLVISIAGIAGSIIGTGLVMIVVRLRRGLSVLEYLGFRKINRKTVLYSLVAIAGLIVLSDGLSYILKRPLNDQPMVDIYNTSIFPALLWLYVVVFAPVFEETLFRGFLFEGLRRSRIGIVGTIILTATVWSLLHLGFGTYDVLVIFIGGIVLGIARYRTGSLWSTIIMHAFVNVVATFEVAINVNRLSGLG